MRQLPQPDPRHLFQPGHVQVLDQGTDPLPLGAVIVRRSGCGLPPSLAQHLRQVSRLVPISRKLSAPASTHATAAASTKTMVNRRPAAPVSHQNTPDRHSEHFPPHSPLLSRNTVRIKIRDSVDRHGAALLHRTPALAGHHATLLSFPRVKLRHLTRTSLEATASPYTTDSEEP